jgi:hypothetical protein
MAEAVLLLFALLALGSPPVSIIFLLAAVGASVWRHYRLRRDLNDLREDWRRESGYLGREIDALRRQLKTSVLSPTAETKAAASESPHAQDVPAGVEEFFSKTKTPAPESVLALTETETPLTAEKSPVAASEISERISEPVVPLRREEKSMEGSPPTSVVAQTTAAPPPLDALKEEVIAPATNTPKMNVPELVIAPTAQDSVTPTVDTAKIGAPESVPEMPLHTVTPPPPPPPVAPYVARVAPAPVAPQPNFQQRLKSVSGLEETLGTNWLNKLGIVLLVLGVASFGIYKLQELGPLGKAAISYLAGAALLAGGIFLEKSERYTILGRTGIGGGWALLFFTTYALNHVQAMRVLSSETTDLVLMLGVAGAMVAHTLRYNSQLVTGLAFLLAYTTVSLSHDNVYSLTAGVVLAVGLVSIVVTRGWFELEIFGILSSYLNHLYWLYRLLGPNGAAGQSFPEYHASTALLFFYWSAFRISYVVRRIRSATDEHASTAAALLNTLLLLVAMKFQSAHPELAFYAFLIIGAVEFSCGQLPSIRKRREAFIVLTVMGVALMIAAVPFRYSGNNVVVLWLIGAETLLIAGVLVDEVIFRRLGLLGGLLAGAHFIAIEFTQLATLRQSSEATVLASGIVFALSSAVLYLNALYIGERWKQSFSIELDEYLLTAQCYLAGFAAAASAWALFGNDSTAVAFAAVTVVLITLCNRVHSRHLQVQYCAIALLTLYRAAAVNLHTASPLHSHVTGRLVTLPLIAAAFYVSARMSRWQEASDQNLVRAIFAAAGTTILTLLIYFEVPSLWQPLTAIVFALLLYEAGSLLHYPMLAWHTHAVAAFAVVTSLNPAPSGESRWHGIPAHAFAAIPVVAGAYWLARRIKRISVDDEDLGRMAYGWVGTSLMAWIIEEALRTPWVAVGWIAFAVLLTIAGRRIPYKHLGWQASGLAAAACVWIVIYNFPLQETLWLGLSRRLVTVSLVAAGIYSISRAASTPESEYKKESAFLHTAAATTLLAVVAWYEAPTAWLATIWAVFALALSLTDRRFDLEDLGWQSHILAALAFFRCLAVNLEIADSWHGVSLRLLTLASVACVFYILVPLARMHEEWRSQDLHHAYTWAASALVSITMWYELRPLSIALAWAIFGLVLFEVGSWRKVNQLRYQSYVAFVAAFVRNFFANLTAGSPGEFWGPRTATVLPIALIFFYVYMQLARTGQPTDQRLRTDTILAYLGTGTVVALCYFQFALDWVATAWAVVVFALLAVARMTGRRIFLQQGLVLSIAVLSRGLIHNLFDSSYFADSNWTGRYFVLGSAIFVLYMTLPFAFALRDRNSAQAAASEQLWRKAVTLISRRPEQLLFFVPTILLTVMLALKMRSGMVTVSWGVEGVAIILLALVAGERSYRLTGLGLLLACVAKIIAMDAWGLAPRDRYVTFIILGAALLLVSFLYSKYREAIRQFL